MWETLVWGWTSLEDFYHAVDVSTVTSMLLRVVKQTSQGR